MTVRAWSVYIHFPYCLHRCSYCDFATAVAREIPREAYRDAILRELSLRSRDLPAAPIATVFFGGGTPSLWGPENVGAVLTWLDRWNGLRADAEVTIEANPGALESGRLDDYVAVGVNRVSVGVQALDDRRLRLLDRLHDAAKARATLAEMSRLLASGRLRSANADLIFGAPGQTLADLRSDVEGVMAYDLPHLSAYSLTVEQGTPLHERVARGLQLPPDDSLQADMLDVLPEWLAQWGLARYEVSNFARPGHECRHNLAYWTGQFYLSAGVGAHGFLPAPGPEQIGWRYGNVRGHRQWLDALQVDTLAEEMREPIDPAMHMTERLLTGLRLAEGLDLAALRLDLGTPAVERLLRRATLLQARGQPLQLTGDRLRVDPTAMRLLDGIVLSLAD